MPAELEGGVGLQSQDARARVLEVPHVVEVVERNQISAQHAMQQLAAHGEFLKELAGGKGRVQKVPTRNFGDALADQAREQHEFIIVDQHQVPFGVKLRDPVGEQAVEVLERLELRGEVPLVVVLPHAVRLLGAVEVRGHEVQRGPQRVPAEPFHQRHLGLVSGVGGVGFSVGVSDACNNDNDDRKERIKTMQH